MLWAYLGRVTAGVLEGNGGKTTATLDDLNRARDPYNNMSIE